MGNHGRIVGIGAILWGALFVGSAAAAVFIVKDGRPQAEIVISENPPRTVKLAAAELQTYIAKISGATLPITNAPGAASVKIYVGRSAYTDRLGLSDEGLKYDAFRMVSGRKWLALLGQDKDFVPIEPWAHTRDDQARVMTEWDKLTGHTWGHPYLGLNRDYNAKLDLWDHDTGGSLQAVYEFLRSLGVRWYYPGELGEVVPRANRIALPKVDKVIRPEFPVRNLMILYQHISPENLLWRRRLGLNSGHELMGFGPPGHGIDALHSRPEVKAAHPEYFAIWDGKRTEDKPCLSSENLIREDIAYARFLFDHYNAPMVNVTPADGYGQVCECPLCAGKDTPARGPDGRISDYVWGYVNRVATELYKTHPDRMVSGLAYTSYLLPPEMIDKMSPNVAVVFVRWRSSYTDPQTKTRELKLREDWLAKLPSKAMYLWSEYPHGRPRGWYSRLPVYYPRLIAEDLRGLKGKSLGELIYVANNWPDWKLDWDALAANHLNAYVTARLYWGVDQNLDAMLDEYYKLFYGPAAAEMKTFVEYCEKTWWKVGTGEITVPEIEKMIALLGQAKKKAGDGVYGQRFAILWNYSEPRLRGLFLEKGGKQAAPRITLYTRDVRHGVPWMLDLDGRLDEPSWANDPKHSLVDAVSGSAPQIGTYFQMGTDGEFLYLGIHCDEPEMKSLRLSGRGKDSMNVRRDDSVALILSPATNTHYHLSFNPDGASIDEDRTKADLSGIAWNSGAESAAFKTDTYWSVEARIPLKALSPEKPSAEHPWRFNVGRVRPRDTARQVSILAPSGRQTFRNLDRTAELVIE